MKLFLLIIFSSIINLGQLLPKFVTYGINGKPEDGDDNKIQAINFFIPENYQGDVVFRIFDADCSGNHDSKFGEFNSSFRFSLFNNQYKEEDFIPSSRYSNHQAELITSITVSIENSFDDAWINFAKTNKTNANGAYFTLVIEGLEGNDANVFQVFLSSSENENAEIPGSVTYSFQPSVRLIPTDKKISLRFFVYEYIDEIYLHTFDFDKSKIFMSTILRDDIPLVENNPSAWSRIKFRLDKYESNNWLSFNYGPVKIDYNDVNFKITDKSGNGIGLPMLFENKIQATVPQINLTRNYIDCNNLEFDLTSSTDYQNNLISFSSRVDNVVVSDKSKFALYFPRAGNFQLEVYAESDSRSITKAKVQTFNFRINSLPFANAGYDIVAATNEKIFFDSGKSIDYDGQIKNYFWNFGDGNFAYGKTATHNYIYPGTYQLLLKVTDDFPFNCNSSTDTVIVTVNSKPVIVTDKKIIGAVGEELVFDASQSFDNDGSIISYRWDFGKFGIDQGQRIVRRFSTPGKYKATLSVRDNSTASNSINSTEIEIDINYPPVADAGSNKFVAVDETVFLDARRSFDRDGTITSYSWDFGDGTNGTGLYTSHSYSKPGAYNVTLEVIDNSSTINNSNKSSITVFVNHPPIAKIETDKFLNTLTAFFDASSSYDPDGEVLTYNWNFGDGSIGTGKTISHNYATSGTYFVTLNIIDNSMRSNNTSSITEQIIINKAPIADAGRDRLVSTNQIAFFSSNSSVDPDGEISSVKWFINGQLISEEREFEYSFSQPGIYDIALEVTDNFPKPLSDIDHAAIRVNSAPIAKISGDMIVAPNDKIKLNAYKSFDEDGRIVNYKWLIDDGVVYYGNEIELLFSKPNIYRVILQVTDDSNVLNSVSYDTCFIKVNSSPIISVSDNIESCNSFITIDASASYDPDGDDLLFIWTLPNRVEITGSSILNYNLSQRGIIPVILTVNDMNNVSNSVSKKSIMIKLNNVPVANAGNDTSICAGDVVLFSALKSFDIDNSSLEYLWKFDDGTEATGNNVIKKYKVGGIYKATLFVKDNSGLECNTSKDEKIITVYDGPIANAGKDLLTCSNTAIQFDGSNSSDIDGVVNSYEWDFGDGEKGSGVSPVHIYSKAGIYKVKLTVYGDLSGECDNTDTDEITVTVNDAPYAIFNSLKEAAENQPIIFDASESNSISGNIVNYEWNFGDGEKSFGKITQHSFPKYGKYKVILKVLSDSRGDCSQSLYEKEILVNSKPLCDIVAPTAGAINEIIKFNASNSTDIDGRILKYQWDFGDGYSAEGIEVNHIYKVAGKYYPKLTVYDNSLAENNFDTKEFEIKINSTPVADFTIQENISVNSTLHLDASSSYDLDGVILNYTWLINDKVISTEKSLNYSFTKPGFYNIKLIVADDSGQKNSTNEIVKTIVVY